MAYIFLLPETCPNARSHNFVDDYIMCYQYLTSTKLNFLKHKTMSNASANGDKPKYEQGPMCVLFYVRAHIFAVLLYSFVFHALFLFLCSRLRTQVIIVLAWYKLQPKDGAGGAEHFAVGMVCHD
jgi:hypothetical protein